jgi:hypothetical protein
MIVYRDRRNLDKVWVGLWSAPILLGLTVLLRDYDLIPSIAGWTVVGTSLVLFWVLLVVFFFGKEKGRSRFDERISHEIKIGGSVEVLER